MPCRQGEKPAPLECLWGADLEGVQEAAAAHGGKVLSKPGWDPV